jgi:hypothetical protein
VLAELDRLVDWLETGGVDTAELFGTTDERDWMLRLTAALLTMLDEHEVDDSGRCGRCREPRSGLGRVLPGSRRAPQCLVLRNTLKAFGDTIEAVWSKVLGALGSDMTEDEVRDWLASAGEQDDSWQNLSLFSVDVVNGYGLDDGPRDGTEFNRDLLRGAVVGPEERTEPISGWFRPSYLFSEAPTEQVTALRGVLDHDCEQTKVWRTPEEMAAETAVLARIDDTLPILAQWFMTRTGTY